MTEDQVRKQFEKIVCCDTGQTTTFKNLGFNEYNIKHIKDSQFNTCNLLNNKPDGWHIDKNINFCLVAEIKSSTKKLDSKVIEQLKRYIKIAKTKYKNVIGIAYNGFEQKIFKNFEEIKSGSLNHLEYYKKIFAEKEIDKESIYRNTKNINDLLHFNFGIKNLNDRMVFTACLLVSKNFGCNLGDFWDIETIKNEVSKKLLEHFNNNGYYKENPKLSILIDSLNSIKIDREPIQEDIIKFLDSIEEISDCINSSKWRGEDVMAIFFNEFSRYKGKTENGQVFTPEHIASLMYKIANITHNHNVLDACCGSGTFLVKAMSYMLDEVGGNDSKESKIIKQDRLYGIENDKSVFSLACANMLLHKDGKSNIQFLDSTSVDAGKWIKDKNIKKVLMNPPYENKHKPLDIIENVLNNVEQDADCLFYYQIIS